MTKQERMARLRSEVGSLAARICDPKANVVCGEGDLDSPIVLVGEAPGAEEDRLGRPFVGQAGVFLDRALEAAGVVRQRVYIANAVKCRPVRSGRGRVVNRRPTAREIRAWRDVLLREVEIVGPKVILCLGAVAASAVLGHAARMSADSGKWVTGPFGTRVICTFHPAYARRSRPAQRELFFGDLQVALGFAGLL